MDTSKTGVWIDTRSDKVVESEPEEGIQLVAPGGLLDPDTQARIDRERAARSGAAPSKPPTVKSEATGRTARA